VVTDNDIHSQGTMSVPKPVQKMTIKKTKKKVILKQFEEPTDDNENTTSPTSKPRLKIVGRRDH